MWTRRAFLETSLKTGGGLTAAAQAFGQERQPASEVAIRVAEGPSALATRITINGTAQAFTTDVRMSLLDLLRERLRLTGTKKGCNHGACGACTVLVDGRRVLACLTLAVTCDGKGVTTIEGVGTPETLHPLQSAFIEEEAFQCGYCTSGQIMSGLACIAEGHTGSPEEIREWMSGNICRCGAYPGIVSAIERVARKA
jgi:xanthine dehydrogenase YagT iron-sulfur-binding subunit